MKKKKADAGKETLIEICQKKGVRATSKRKIICEVLEKSGGHLNVEEVYHLAKKEDKSIGVATVYRTLKIMKDAGVIEAQTFGQDHSHFESPTKNHHDHLVCTSCGKIEEFVSDKLEEMKEKVSKQNRFKMLSHKLEIYGLCADCQKKG